MRCSRKEPKGHPLVRSSEMMLLGPSVPYTQHVSYSIVWPWVLWTLSNCVLMKKADTKGEQGALEGTVCVIVLPTLAKKNNSWGRF